MSGNIYMVWHGIYTNSPTIKKNIVGFKLLKNYFFTPTDVPKQVKTESVYNYQYYLRIFSI